MSKEIIKEAASIEEAKALIAAELGVAEDAIAFEIVQEPEKKVLGIFGGTAAIVKGTVIGGGSAAAAAEDYLRKVLAGLGVEDFTLAVTEQDNGCVISLDGENLGFIIGRRGETLDALQYLTSLKVNRGQEGYTRVTLDTENYREKRVKTLENLAKRLAAKVVKGQDVKAIFSSDTDAEDETIYVYNNLRKECVENGDILTAKLFETIKDSGIELVATECGTCKVQIMHGTGKTVEHPLSILRQRLEGAK